MNEHHSAPCWCGSRQMRLFEITRNGITTRCCLRCSNWTLLWSTAENVAEMKRMETTPGRLAVAAKRNGT